MTGADAGVSREHILHLLGEMLRIRRFEDRCVDLYGKGFIRGFLHLYNGEEAVAVGVMQALEAGDAVVSTYREHGHALLKGVPAGEIMAEMFARVEGCCRGRGGSKRWRDWSLYSDQSHHVDHGRGHEPDRQHLV